MKDIKFKWKPDAKGFLPQEIIDKEDEPCYYINAKYSGNEFIIVTYGENIDAVFTDKSYKTIVYKIDKSIVDNYVLNTSKDGEDFWSFSNLSIDDKKDPIKLAFAMLEFVSDNDIVFCQGYDTKLECRNIAHFYFN